MIPTAPIAEFARQYSCSGTARLHMPGHKGVPFLGCEPLDLTEIAGADELYEAEGIIAQSEANAARLFGTAATYYSAGGSSQCIRAMLMLAMQAAPQGAGRPVLLAARNAHKALVYSAALLDFEIQWLWPQGEGASLCSCPVPPERLRVRLEELIRQGRRPFGVYLTSPDYLGYMQDVAALAAVCRSQGVPLLVDNAHGAYLPFLPGGSRHPIALGAAMCCDSGHKTLPVLTGGAYLHLGPDAPVSRPEAVRGAMALFGSTSPSYLILQSLDLCNPYLAQGYPERLAGCIARLERLRTELNAASVARQTPVPLVLSGPDREPLKLTLDAAALGRTGQWLAGQLRHCGIECEYADQRSLVLMFTPENPPEDAARVRAALQDLLEQAGQVPPAPEDPAPLFVRLAEEQKPVRSIREAVLAPAERVPLDRALGRVCALPTVSCPPAIPIAVSGEEIGPAALVLMRCYGVTDVAVCKE